MSDPGSEDDGLRTYLAERDVPCPGCGYNLRGLDDGTCPECGYGFNLAALVEFDRRERFRRMWRRALALEYRWLAAGLGILLCSLVVATKHWGGGSSSWLPLFQLGGRPGSWTSWRGTGWAVWAGIAAAGVATWSQENPELSGPSLTKIARRAVVGLLGAHVIAACLAWAV